MKAIVLACARNNGLPQEYIGTIIELVNNNKKPEYDYNFNANGHYWGLMKDDIYILQSIVPNEEVLKELELFGAFAIKNAFNEKEINSLMKKYDLIKQALTTPKISEEGKFGSGHHKLFVKNKKYKQLRDKIEIKREGLKFYVKGICYEEEISSYLYHDIKALKSIGGNK